MLAYQKDTNATEKGLNVNFICLKDIDSDCIYMIPANKICALKGADEDKVTVYLTSGAVIHAHAHMCKIANKLEECAA